MKWFAQIFNPILKHIDLSLSKHVNAVICNSDYSLDMAKQIYTYPKNMLNRAYLGIDPEDFQLQNKTRSRRIITVSRLSRFKNIHWIIEAFAQLVKEKHQDVFLDIVGDGEVKKELQSLVTQLDLEQKVMFHGDIADPKKIRSLLSRARVFVLASVNEPFGIAPIEAMACGTPAIVTNTGGAKETVIHGKTGFQFEPGNIIQLSDYCEQLLTDRILFNKLSLEASKRAKKFSWRETTNIVRMVFEKL